MKRMRISKLRVFFITVLAFLALGGLGHSYAYLISRIKITSQFKTGDFDNVFSMDRLYHVDIVNMANGEPDVVKAVNAEVKVLDDAKSAEVIFKEGVPQELFDDNNYLETINGEEISFEAVKKDGFDYIKISTIDEDEIIREVLNLELA